MIEVRDGKMAFVAAWTAVKRFGSIEVVLSQYIVPGDSEDEAIGRSRRMADIEFPASDGWSVGMPMLTRIDNLAWVGMPHMDKLKPWVKGS